jgi:hypothetical protein
MGKRNSSATSTATGAAAKKAKTADADGSVIGRWVQTKVGDKELSQAEKMGLLKNTLMTHKYRGSQQSSREVLPKFIDLTQGEPKNICKP